jgi:hypothetical protein
MRLRASTVEMLIVKRSSQRSVVLDEVVRVVLFTKVDVATFGDVAPGPILAPAPPRAFSPPQSHPNV